MSTLKTRIAVWQLLFLLYAGLAPLFCLDDVARDLQASGSYSRGALSTLPRVDPAGVLQVWTWNQFSASEFHRGHFPLWNPHTALGQPHLANLQTAVFYPLSLVQACFAEPLTGDLILLLRLALAATLVFLMVYNLGGKPVAAVAAGLIYAYGGYGLWFVQLVDLNSQLLLPLLMLVFNKLFTARTWPNLIAASLVLALTVLGGHPEAVFNTIAVGYLYLLFLMTRGRRFVALAPALAAGAAGLMLAGLVLLPFADYLPRCWSLHQPGFGFFHLEVRGLLNLFWPGIHRLFADQPAAIPLDLLERGTRGLFLSGYRETAVPGVPPGLGLVPMALALWAIARLRRLPPLAAFFATLLAVLLGLTFGLPGFRLLALLPFFNLASNFKFYFSEIALALAVLAGFGLDQLIFFGFRGAPDSRRAKRRAKLFSSILIAILIGNLFYHSRDVKPYLDLGTDRLSQAPYLKSLQDEYARSGPFRITGLEGFFPPNLALAYGLDDLRSSDALFYRPSLELLNTSNGLDERQSLRYFYPSYYTQPSPERLNHPLAALLGIRYAVGRRPLQTGEIIEQILYHGFGVYGEAKPQKLVDYTLDPPRPVLFQHPPSAINWLRPFLPGTVLLGGVSSRVFEVIINDPGYYLRFSPWWDKRATASDGAFFLLLHGQNTPQIAWARFIVPQEGGFSEQAIFESGGRSFDFITLPGPRNIRNSDWAGWTINGSYGYGAPAYQDYLALKNIDQNGRPVFLNQAFYAYTGVFPRAFTVSQSRQVEPEDESKVLANANMLEVQEAYLLDAWEPTSLDIYNFYEAAWSSLRETVTIREKVEVNGIPGDHYPVKLLTYEPDRIEAEARRDSEGLLILTDAYYPGWRAWVDGAEARIYRADHALRAVVLTPGTHRVLFRYQPFDFRLGLWSSLATLAMAGAALSLSLRKKRLAGHD